MTLLPIQVTANLTIIEPTISPCMFKYISLKVLTDYLFNKQITHGNKLNFRK